MRSQNSEGDAPAPSLRPYKRYSRCTGVQADYSIHEYLSDNAIGRLFKLAAHWPSPVWSQFSITTTGERGRSLMIKYDRLQTKTLSVQPTNDDANRSRIATIYIFAASIMQTHTCIGLCQWIINCLTTVTIVQTGEHIRHTGQTRTKFIFRPHKSHTHDLLLRYLCYCLI